MDKNNIHLLMQNIIENKEKYFEILYREYKDFVFKIVFVVIKNKDDAEDITQNIFMKIYKLPVEKLPTKNETSWLYAVSKNETLNYIKSKKKDINIEELQIYAKENNILDEIDFKGLIKELDTEEELIVKLKTEYNFTFKEIAKVLGKNENTVKWKYYSALHTLKILLTNLCMFAISLSLIKIMDKELKIKQNISENNNNNKLSNEEETTVTDSIVVEENSSSQSIKENVLEENTVEITEYTKYDNTNYNLIKMTLVVVSIFFFIFSVIFLIKFIKCQLNKKKKLSK